MIRIALLVLSAAVLAGCASDADDGFFTRGWLNPRELDESTARRHKYHTPPPPTAPQRYKRDPLVDY